MMVSISKRSMFYICVASSSYHINNKILRHAGKFPLGLVHQKRPPQVPTKQCFPCILWKILGLVGGFFGDQPKWKISSERWCIKDGVWHSGVWKMVCERERVTKLCVKDGVWQRWCVKDGVWQRWLDKDGVWQWWCVTKMVCERWCVWQRCVRQRCWPRWYVKDAWTKMVCGKDGMWKMVCDKDSMWKMVYVCER